MKLLKTFLSKCDKTLNVKKPDFPCNTKIGISGIKSTYLILFLLYSAFQNSDQTTMNENRIKLEMEHKLRNEYTYFVFNFTFDFIIFKTLKPAFKSQNVHEIHFLKNDFGAALLKLYTSGTLWNLQEPS